MRKIVSILLFVAIATVLAVGSASAASIVGTAHDVTLIDSTLGTCSACHIPHKTAGTKRLWAKSMGTNTANGTVGNLCTACHASTGGYTGTTIEAAKCADYVLPEVASMAHKLESNWATSSTGVNGAADELNGLSGLPYLTLGTPDPEDGAGDNLIQCTSCHNVHDNANRPFLRRDIRDLCVTCHKGRGGSVTADAGSDTANLQTDWNYTTNAGINNYGSHPVGANVNKTISNRAETVTFTVEWFNFFEGGLDGTGGAVDTKPATPSTDGSGNWNLGRHAATGTSTGGLPGDGKQGGVVCVSCHAVHGYQDDANAAISVATNMAPVGNLLGIAQGQFANQGDMLVYNGNGDPANFLCESCHHNSNGGVKWTGPAQWASDNFHQNDAAGTVYASSNWPNPGASAYTHPIDDALIVSPDTLVTSFNGNLWPGPTDGGATTDNPICESCHVPHPNRDKGMTGRTDTNAGAGAYILRDNLDEICNGCHNTSVTVPKHHPTGTMVNMASVGVPGSGRTGNGAHTTNTGGGNSLIGNSDDQLTCGDCHNSGDGSNGGAAHNWNDRLSGIALDPDWDADSESCEQCHYRIRAGVATIDNANLVPTQDAGEDWGTADYGEYNKGAADSDAIGTHFLGDIADGFVWTLGQDSAGTTINLSTGTWPTNIPGVSTFTGTDAPKTILGARGANDGAPPTKGHLICESCHELEPRKNNSGGKLLLANFAEGDTPSADRDSYFCEGCHGHNPGAVGSEKSHPLSGDIVSGTGSIPDTSKFSAGGNATYPVTDGNLISCDSCHQVHDAVTNSATFILDGADSSVSINSGYSLTSGRGGDVTGGSHNEHPRALSDSSGVYDGMGRLGLDYTAYCQQCHVY